MPRHINGKGCNRGPADGNTTISFAYVIEPRFSGGTSAAVAAELRAIAGLAPITVHARSSAMFGTATRMAPVLKQTIADLGVPVIWDAPRIVADVVIVHNPSFLKYQSSFGAKIYAQSLIVVAHENFLRPGGIEAFDVAGCLRQLDHATLALRKCIAPISVYNRRTVEAWLAGRGGQSGWTVAPQDWFNICELPIHAPTATPRDRRGRHSRPTREKYPSVADLDLCFPPQAETNLLLGADFLVESEIARPYWSALPFGSMQVESFLKGIDFYVYFTAPTWRESFGRAIAEALAAGKVVMTDPETGATFGDAVVCCQPAEVSGLIESFVADPERYVAQVQRAKPVLEQLSAPAFRRRFSELLGTVCEATG